MAGVTFGNLNAMALQHMGHVAGMAASVVAAVSTIGAVLIAAPVGQLYDGTALPMVLATLACSGLALLLMRRVAFAYPLGIVVFSGFIVTQLHRWSHTHSPVLLALSALDLVVIGLTWREWRGQRG